MKFVIEHLSKTSGRLGHLVQQESGKQFKTPLLVQVTKGGSIPYLSRDVFDHVTQEQQVLQMSLATMDHMKEALTHFKGGGLSGFVGYKDYPTFLTIRDPCELIPGGFNEKDIVPLFTRRGKEPLTVQKFVSLVEAFKPDIYQGLCDADTNFESAKKRIQKSVDRTEAFMEACYEHHNNSETLKKSCLFAPIVGGYNTFNRSQSIKHAKAKGAAMTGGYIFEGFHSYGLSATEVKSEQIMPIMSHCLKELDMDKPFMLPGAFTPVIMLKLIQLGVDIFDSSYAYCAAANFKVLSFNFDLSKKTTTETPFIDVTDECLKEDFNPLLKDCSCLACQKHTRAYINHLYKTSELLGPILIMIHNLHHLMQFFNTIHNCISNDNLNELIELIEKQGGDKPVEYRIEANTKVISRAGLGKGFADAKV
ncbi:queuine tRNA-ribosyltransferase accessory subunit 2 [Lucilia sericata]|uniref:queuine tRNA-ribosyltransferase accessory subunit 2 n=1 Tax=Lucilia sericata TaxID=13632 RepID=UPI0018A830B8|nr:queuine tRNA-ribosyltransferase accessory subunit 2 [Lucilia sericata]